MNGQHHMTKTQLVTQALIKSLTAKTEAKSAAASRFADSHAIGLTNEQIERVGRDSCKSQQKRS